MKAAVLEGCESINIKDVADPDMGPEDVLIRVDYAGVCGSDIHAFKGQHPFRKPPVVLGHEVSGTVEKVGAAVLDLAEGDRVTVMPYRACGRCESCLSGRPNTCISRTMPGMGEWVGTFAELFRAGQEIVFRLGSRTSLALGALAEPLAVAVHSAQRGGVSVGDDVLILGGGTIGLLTAVAAKIAGAGRVALTDLFGHNLAVAAALGCDDCYDATDPGLEGSLNKVHPQGFDVVFLTAGAPGTVAQALEQVKRGGRIVVVAMFLEPISFPLLDVTMREIEVVGSQIYTRHDFVRALEWLDAGQYPLDDLITHVLPLKEAERSLQLASGHEDGAIKVLLRP